MERLRLSERELESWERAVDWLRHQAEHRQLVHDSYYDDPLLAAAQRYRESGEWAAVRRYLPAGRRLRALDLGAGRGIVSYALAACGMDVVALEPDESALVGCGAIEALARDSELPISVLRGLGESIPCADASFDVVIARAVLHHSRSLPAVCAEAYRVLKPGGRFVPIREHVVSRRADLPTFLASHPLHHRYGGEHAFLLQEYTSALFGAGFSTVQVIKPLESEINFAPYSEATLKAAFTNAICGNRKMLERVVSRLLGVPLFWRGLRQLAGMFDSRPGRHYSFVAIRGGR